MNRKRVECPFCGRQIAVARAGWIWYHRTKKAGEWTSRICMGSGYAVPA